MRKVYAPVIKYKVRINEKEHIKRKTLNGSLRIHTVYCSWHFNDVEKLTILFYYTVLMKINEMHKTRNHED